MKISINSIDGKDVALFGINEGFLYFESNTGLEKVNTMQGDFDYANRFCFRPNNTTERDKLKSDKIKPHGAHYYIDAVFFDVDKKKFNELFSWTPAAESLRKDIYNGVQAAVDYLKEWNETLTTPASQTIHSEPTIIGTLEL